MLAAVVMLSTVVLLQFAAGDTPTEVAAAAPGGADIVVNPGQLQGALDSANPGDRILLSPGTYAENITIRRGGQAGAPITITRAAGATPMMTGRWQVRAAYISVSRVIFDGSSHGDYPIWVTRGDGGADGSFFTLQYSEIRNAHLSGVFVGDTSPPVPLRGVSIRGCYLHDNGTTGQDHGIFIKSGSGHTIKGNLITGSSGAAILNSPNARGMIIRGNEIRQNGAGISITRDLGDEPPIVNNTVVDGNYLKDNRGLGVSLKYDGDVSTVPPGVSNTVTNNWAAGNAGGDYGTGGLLGESDYTRGATWLNNAYGDPAGGLLVAPSDAGPDGGLGSASSSEHQVVVNPGQLQAALDAANPGDQILLNPGTYTENITITHGGQAGAPITITRAAGATPVMTGRWQVRAPYISVSRLIFDGSSNGDYPIWVTRGVAGADGSYFILQYSEVRNSHLSGVFVGDTAPAIPLHGVAIRGCYIHDNGATGHDHGIYIKSGSGHTIKGNLITGSSGFGIQDYPHAKGLFVIGNEIRGNGAGILIEHDAVDEPPLVNNTLVDGNYLKGNGGMGISLMYDGDVSIVPPGISNTISNNWAAGNAGGDYGTGGLLGNSDYTRGATWVNNTYGDPAGGALVSPSDVGPDAP